MSAALFSSLSLSTLTSFSPLCYYYVFYSWQRDASGVYLRDCECLIDCVCALCVGAQVCGACDGDAHFCVYDTARTTLCWFVPVLVSSLTSLCTNPSTLCSQVCLVVWLFGKWQRLKSAPTFFVTTMNIDRDFWSCIVVVALL